MLATWMPRHHTLLQVSGYFLPFGPRVVVVIQVAHTRRDMSARGGRWWAVLQLLQCGTGTSAGTALVQPFVCCDDVWFAFDENSVEDEEVVADIVKVKRMVTEGKGKRAQN